MTVNLSGIRRTPHRLFDGALVIAGERAERVEKMAAALVEADAFRTERDAIMALMHAGFHSIEIFRHDRQRAAGGGADGRGEGDERAMSDPPLIQERGNA